MAQEVTRQIRLKSLGWGVLLTGLIILGRLFYLQVIRHDHYQALADEIHLSKFEIPARRGEIYVLDGQTPVPLVLNQLTYRLYADPRYIEEPATTASAIATLTGGDVATYQAQLEKDGAYVVLEKRIRRELGEQLKAKNLAGIGLTEIPAREYPEGSLAAQVVGFVNDEGRGQYGLEQALDSSLRGQSGQLSGAVDIHGIPIATAENVQAPAHDGDTVVLTIDRAVQAVAERSLAGRISDARAKGGSVLVIDSRNGDIKAMASAPTFNPADFRSAEDIGVFNNPVVNLAYEPGSVIKAFTMAIGLESGVVTPETTYKDTSIRQIDGFTIKNSVIRPTAIRTMRDVIRLSLNTGSIFVLEQLGGGDINNQAKEALYNFFTTKLRLDQPTGIAQAGEVKGVIDPPKGVSDVRFANMTFGQGMNLTMVRLTAAFGSLVNGGTYFEPRLVGQTIATDGSRQITEPVISQTNVIRPETSATLVEMLRAVVEEGAGRRAKRPGYIIGGKTGTAQKYDSATGTYFDDRVVSSFFGFTGNQDSRYAVVVRVDEPVVNIPGASSASLVFADMSNWLIDYYALRPSQ